MTTRLGAGEDAAPTTALGGGSIVIHRDAEALHAAGGPADSLVGSVLRQDDLEPTVEQAVEYWIAQGITAAALENVRLARVQSADLAGNLLGIASSSDLVWIDRDAAGFGWDVGATSTGMDLLSVVTHELGHKLGLDHATMDDALAPGTRRLPVLRLAPGDANRDGRWDQLDLVQVLQAAKYLADTPASWEEGDWNADGLFDQLDLVSALETGDYIAGYADEVFAELGG